MRSVDEQYSIGKYLTGKYSLQNTVQRRQTAVSRPYFRIEEGPGGTTPVAAIGHLDIRNWTIWYFGETEATNRAVKDEISDDLANRQMLAAYLSDFPYTKPTLQAYNSGSGSITGVVNVQVSGLVGGVESMTSPTASVSVESPNDAVRIQFPKLPFGKTRFDAYNVYVETGGAMALQKNVSHGSETMVNKQTTITSISAGVLPLTTSEILWGRIIIDSIDTEMIEDPEKGGQWDTKISLITQSNGLVRNDPRMSRLLADLDPDPQSLLLQQVTVEISDQLPYTVPLVFP